MSKTTEEMRAQVAALLGAALERGALLRAIDALSREPDFEDCADLWAPALYARDADFFETFLLRHLRGEEPDAIQAVLARAEADGRDELFRGLYPRIASPDTWNKELLALAHSPESDERVRPAVERRRLTGTWYSLSGKTALALYQRNPTLYGNFVAEHIRAGARTKQSDYADLLAEAQRRGDEAFYWRIFRATAGSAEWADAVRHLLAEAVPPERIVAELELRQPAYTRDLDGAVMAELLTTYRAAVLPYIERNVTSIGRKSAPRLVQAAEKLGDEALFWRIFFLAGSSPEWNKALVSLAERAHSPEALAAGLRWATPPATLLGRWVLAPQTALALYQRDPLLTRPLIEQWLVDVDEQLFAAVERAGDEELLDFLTSRLLWNLAWVVYEAYPTPSEAEWKRSEPGASERLERWGLAVAARLDRLYARSPATYVEHAARILSFLEQSDGWSFKRNMQQNPVFAYLFTQHREAWLQSPAAIRELLESLNPVVQLTALAFLGVGSPDAADRAVEQVDLLRALLLGEAPRNVKKRALAILEQAARQSSTHAANILPVLAEALYFRAGRAIDERVMVSYVRLRSSL
jgi:hypothetical protein